MGLLLLSAYYSYKALFRWLRPSTYFSMKIVLPLGQLSFFALIGQFGKHESAAFYLVGNAMAIATISGIYSVATAVTDERREGTLLYLLASPANRPALFYGRALFHVVDGALNVAIAFVWAVLIFGLVIPPERWAPLAGAIVVGTLAASGVGMLVGALAYLFLDVGFLANVGVFGVLLLSGTNIALRDLPPAFQALAQGIPLTRSIGAARGIVAGEELAAQLGLLAQDLLIGAVYALAAFALFRWTEYRARGSGSLALG